MSPYTGILALNTRFMQDATSCNLQCFFAHQMTRKLLKYHSHSRCCSPSRCRSGKTSFKTGKHDRADAMNFACFWICAWSRHPGKGIRNWLLCHHRQSDIVLSHYKIQGQAKLMELSLVTHVPSGPIGCGWAGHFAWQEWGGNFKQMEIFFAPRCKLRVIVWLHSRHLTICKHSCVGHILWAFRSAISGKQTMFTNCKASVLEADNNSQHTQ